MLWYIFIIWKKKKSVTCPFARGPLLVRYLPAGPLNCGNGQKLDFLMQNGKVYAIIAMKRDAQKCRAEKEEGKR